MIKNLFAFAFLFAMLSPLSSIAQKKVMGLPEAFVSPKDYFGNMAEVEKKMYFNTGNKHRTNAWVVLSDRDNNSVYKSPDEDSQVTRTIGFREKYYVIDESGDWVQIAECPVPPNKLKSKSIHVLGWVEKQKLLLWRHGLVDTKTGIHKKAFLINKAENLKILIEGLNDPTKNNSRVSIFRHPQEKIKESEKYIYSFYFIYKKEGNMYLLGKESRLVDYNIEEQLLGWVDKIQLDEWNTRFCLEPNFNKEAFEERKQNEKLQFRAFASPANFKGWSTTYPEKFEGVVNDYDPVILDPSQMAKSDNKRYVGSVLRLPLFNIGKIDSTAYFRSGSIGIIRIGNDENGKIEFKSEIPEQQYAIVTDHLRKIENRLQKVNLFFVIEGTRLTYATKPKLISAITSLKNNPALKGIKNVRYGALIYKDTPEDEVIKYEALSSSVNKVTDLIEQTSFDNVKDQDDHTAFYYGLKKGLKLAGFSKEAVNIVIVLGSGGDFSKSSIRKKDAIDKEEEALIQGESINEILKDLSDLKIYLHSIQLNNTGLRTSKNYLTGSGSFILNTAKFDYNRRKGNTKIQQILKQNGELNLETPSLPSLIGKTELKLSGSKPGYIILPEKGYIGEQRLKESLNMIVENSWNYESATINLFKSTYDDGMKLEPRKFTQDSTITIPALSTGVISVFEEILANSDIDANFLIGSTDQKLSVYTSVYVPAKAQGAKHNSYEYVLFMPESDLASYQNTIKREIAQASTSGSYDEKRECLFNIYMKLIDQYTGGDYSKFKDPKNLTREDVFQIMQGIYGEGYDMDMALNVKIGDIRNSKIVSNEQIHELLQRLNDVAVGLDGILNRDYYDFRMKASNNIRYYWLTLDQVFR